MSLLGEALDLLRKYGDVVGIDWDKGPSIIDRTLAPAVTNLAGSPILAAAQLTIQGMRRRRARGSPKTGRPSRNRRTSTRRPGTC